MKIFTTFIGSAFIASVSVLGAVQADELMDNIHPESADLFDHSKSINASGTTGIVSLNDINAKAELVWSYEFVEYVNPQDFSTPDYANLDVNAYMEENPTAAAGHTGEVLRWDATADEYQLQ